MADSKITALTAISTVDPTADPLVIVDVSDTSMAASGTTKKSTINQLLGAGGTATLASATITGDLTVDTNTLKVDSANNRVGIGTASPSVALDVVGSAQFSGNLTMTTGSLNSQYWYGINATSMISSGSASWPLLFGINGSEKARIDSSGNVGIGVTPSAWGSNWKANHVGTVGSFASSGAGSAPPTAMVIGAYNDNTNWKYQFSSTGAARYEMTGANAGSAHAWYTSPGGTANNNITFTQAMTLDASGNLLVGITSGSIHTFVKAAALGAGILTLSSSTTGYTTATFYGADNIGANAANTALLINKNNTTGRSINAAGTINASGADYAEYMTKGSDFVLSKGGIAGIDANGKLTNVFADAVSFVVKSTDPSYVGNDKWGVGLEGDALEAARQLVDRIAFAGQVPVNVTGAKAGDYIVPVVDGTGIKGIAVSNPTFEQYQLAVGKVITIDADGRARIIVKVA